MACALCTCILFGIAGLLIASDKGRSEVEGFLLGFFLGVIGIIIEAVLERQN